MQYFLSIAGDMNRLLPTLSHVSLLEIVLFLKKMIDV